MKRTHILSLAAVCFGLLYPAAHAQMGANWFNKPAIAEAVNPVVGKGAQYQTTNRNQNSGKPEIQEITVVGKDSFEGKEAFWLEFTHHADAQSLVYMKILMTRDDLQPHRSIMQQAGQQAMEMPFHPTEKTKSHMQEEIEKWHAVGTETITVPAGTFSCKHWKKDKSANDTGDHDIWTSDKVTPFGMVKEVSADHSMELLKVITDAQDHITGPVKQFDPQAFRQQMMEQMQKQKPQKP